VIEIRTDRLKTGQAIIQPSAVSFQQEMIKKRMTELPNRLSAGQMGPSADSLLLMAERLLRSVEVQLFNLCIQG